MGWRESEWDGGRDEERVKGREGGWKRERKGGMEREEWEGCWYGERVKGRESGMESE